jgi:hypothetical protein
MKNTLLLLLSLCASAVRGDLPQVLTGFVLPQAYADSFGAKCLDGSPPAYAIRPGDPSTWVIFFEGGGWCFGATAEETITSCTGRAAGGLGSSNGYANHTQTVGGVLSTDPTRNPAYYNATLVFAHYCDGASGASSASLPLSIPADFNFSAHRAADDSAFPWYTPPATAPTQIWFRGRANIVATISYLRDNAGLAAARTVVLTGGSAGATTVFIGADMMRGLLPATARVVAAPDAGYFLDQPRASNSSEFWFVPITPTTSPTPRTERGPFTPNLPHYATLTAPHNRYREQFQGADSVWNATGARTLGDACMTAFASEPWRCFLAENNALFTTTPLYVSNSPIDMWALGNILSLGCVPTMNNVSIPAGKACAPSQWATLQQWWSTFHATLSPLLARNSRTGAFIPSCFVHEMNVDYCSGQSLPNCRGWASYEIAPPAGGAPVTLSEALPEWVNSVTSDWTATLAASEDAAKRAPADVAIKLSTGRWPREQSAFGPGQDVDELTYPMNPSCYYPPGR